MARQSVDFDDKDAVLAEMAGEIDVPVERLRIAEDRGMSSFGVGTIYEITAGKREWCVVADEDAERELALAIVTQDLEDEPENFNRSFLEGLIDTNRLRDELYHGVYDDNYEMCEDEAENNPDDFWRRYESDGFTA